MQTQSIIYVTHTGRSNVRVLAQVLQDVVQQNHLFERKERRPLHATADSSRSVHSGHLQECRQV